MMVPISSSPLSIGTASIVRIGSLISHSVGILRIGLHVRNVYRCADRGQLVPKCCAGLERLDSDLPIP